jgi:hypothetical protein
VTSEYDLIDIITLITKDRAQTPLKHRKGRVTSEYDLIDLITLITKDRARIPLKPRKGEGDELKGFD